jgi:hypothetical protein
MQSVNWVTVALSLVGALLGGLVTSMLCRAQQKSVLKDLRDLIDGIGTRNAKQLRGSLDDLKHIKTIRSNTDRINPPYSRPG